MATTPSWPNLVQGNISENVSALQCLLNFRNNNTALAVDGSFGPAVYNAVVAFQKSKGITANGIAGKDTLSRLVAVVQKGALNEAARGAQYLLSKFESLSIDGSFGPGSVTATQAFQGKMGIDVDGSVGPITWQYLFGYNDYPGSGGGSSHTIEMPSGRICCWNQRYPDIVNALNARAPGTGKKGCTIATALNLVNFYGPTNYTIDQIVAAWSSDGMNWRWNFSSCGTKLRVNADSEKLVGTNAFPAIRSEIQAGRPVIVNIGTGNSDNHTVMCYGYKNGGTSYSDFLVMDPIRLTSSGGISTEKVGSDHSLQQAMNNNNHPQGIWCIRRTHSA